MDQSKAGAKGLCGRGGRYVDLPMTGTGKDEDQKQKTQKRGGKRRIKEVRPDSTRT